MELIAARAASEAATEAATEAVTGAAALFADRIAGLEARLPRVEAARAATPASAAAAELEAILALPGLVSLHRK